MAYKVVCVNVKNDCSFKDCRCIKDIGISAQGGGVNKYTPTRMYDRIANGEEFYVEDGKGNKTFLVKAEREGTKYVRTKPNDTESDNLLEQNSCPVN